MYNERNSLTSLYKTSLYWVNMPLQTINLCKSLWCDVHCSLYWFILADFFVYQKFSIAATIGRYFWREMLFVLIYWSIKTFVCLLLKLAQSQRGAQLCSKFSRWFDLEGCGEKGKRIRALWGIYGGKIKLRADLPLTHYLLNLARFIAKPLGSL